MAFDRSNPADLLALKNEVNNDPLGLGYDPLGNTQVLLNLLNLPASNLGGETGPDLVTAERMLAAIFPVTVGAADQFKVQLVFEIAGDPSANIEQFKSAVGGLSAGLQAAIDGIIRPLSRGEVLFSDSVNNYDPVVISRDDWITARDS